MLSINWSDVWKMVESIKVPLIVIGVALALAIIVSLAVFKMGKPARKLTRSTAWVAALIAVVSMLYGGFKTVLDLAAGTGALTDASKAQVDELGNDISDEGMVLLKNNNGALPLAKGSAINVWGWAQQTRSTAALAPARCRRITRRPPSWMASTMLASPRTMS